MTAAQAEPKLNLFHASLARATETTDFFGRFYGRFMASSPELAILMRNKDAGHVQRKLKMTLEMLSDYADGQPGVAMYIEMLACIHARHHVHSKHFEHWHRALIDTIVECDPKLDPATRQAWERVIEDLIAKIESGCGS